MRIDPNYRVFIKNSEWYNYVQGVGYVPTEKAPAEVVAAIKEYNSYAHNSNHKRTTSEQSKKR